MTLFLDNCIWIWWKLNGILFSWHDGTVPLIGTQNECVEMSPFAIFFFSYRSLRCINVNTWSTSSFNSYVLYNTACYISVAQFINSSADRHLDYFQFFVTIYTQCCWENFLHVSLWTNFSGVQVLCRLQ